MFDLINMIKDCRLRADIIYNVIMINEIFNKQIHKEGLLIWGKSNLDFRLIIKINLIDNIGIWMKISFNKLD
jgi:hypothetical protein